MAIHLYSSQKDAKLFFNIFALHRSEQFFGADAEKFVPSRWGDSSLKKNFMPFGLGRRRCLGEHLASRIVKYVTVSIIKRYQSIESKDAREWTERLTLVASSRYGKSWRLIYR